MPSPSWSSRRRMRHLRFWCWSWRWRSRPEGSVRKRRPLPSRQSNIGTVVRSGLTLLIEKPGGAFGLVAAQRTINHEDTKELRRARSWRSAWGGGHFVILISKVFGDFVECFAVGGAVVGDE